MLDIICWIVASIVFISLAALMSFVCHDEADKRRRGGRDESH